MDQEATADIIIVGAGASGCIIAARLAAADPGLRILVLESGPHTLNDPVVVTPARFLENIDPKNAPRTRFIMSEPSEHLLNRQTGVASGCCVGGGSAINFVTYTRPAASDLDEWEFKHENPGWGFKSMLPMFKKFETYEVLAGAATHGYDGPIRISLGTPSLIAQQWLNVMELYEKRIPYTDDLNDFSTSNAYSQWPKIVSSQGVRQDVAHGFLYPALQAPNSNIKLLVGCTVDRVIFKDDVAIGVEYHNNTLEETSTPITVNANRLVVLAAGGLGSPLILERSGIGSSSILSAAGINVKVDLEGVGENYHDHNLIATAYVSAPGVTANRDAYLRGDSEVLASAAAQYARDGSGPSATNAMDAGAKVRPQTLEDARAVGLNDAFLDNWSYFEGAPDKPVFLSYIFAGITIPGGLPEGEFFSTLSLTTYPFSRGSIHIRSPNPKDPPVLIPGYLSHPADVSMLMWQYKWARERARRLPAYRGEVVAAHPNFSLDSQAACSASRSGPVAVDAPDIVYTAEDNQALETWVRLTTQTTWHALGTCAMKPRHNGGVVDTRLNVYGVKRLKVADLSVPPVNVGSNTATMAMAIGEKASVIIAQDLNLVL